MTRKALIETLTGRVDNIIELKDGAAWEAPPGYTTRDADNASPGDTWDGAKFIPRPPTAEEVANTKREAAKQRAITAIKANKTGAPWGIILNDLAVAQGLIEPD